MNNTPPYDFSQSIEKWDWFNKQNDLIFHDNYSVSIKSGGKTDYFIAPLGDFNQRNAPCMYTTVKGNFRASVKLNPEFHSTYDAGGFFITGNDGAWVKFAFEFTDLGYPCVVSVVTVKSSDDANGVQIGENSVWLQVIRKENSLTLHYSLDGIKWNMVRHFAFPMAESLKIGLLSQSPTGEGTTVMFSNFSLSDKIPENVRKGS